MGEGPAVHIEALVKRYGKITALDEVTLSVEQREAFGLVGANGAGKSTLIRCLLDLTAGERGRIEIFGVPASQPAARARLAYLPERFMPPHYLTGTEFLRVLAIIAPYADDFGRRDRRQQLGFRERDRRKGRQLAARGAFQAALQG